MSKHPSNKETQLNAIVGAALRGLVEAGATDEAIGAFAVNHRAKVSEVLGISSQSSQGPVELADLVAAAVKNTLQELGIVKPVSKIAQRVFVNIGGEKTSVSISSELWESLLVYQAGDRKKATSTIEDLANAAPRDIDNRSGWIQQRVTELLLHGDAKPDAQARH